MERTALAAGVGLLMPFLMGVQGAKAQQKPTNGDVVVSDVVVTARRREEALGAVPGSVSAISGSVIALRPLEKIEDFLRETPSATIVFSGPDYLKDVSIRGQGGGRNGFSESSTGLYRNGAYVAGGGFGGRSFNALDLFDVKSFEVYRGPQGALYGRNAVGGAVNLVSQQPSDRTLISGQIGYDDRDRTDYQAIVNIPLASGKAALRLGAVGYDQNEGFIRDLTTGAYLDQTDFKGQRASLRISDILSFATTLSYEHSDSNAPGFTPLGQRTFVTARPTAAYDPQRDYRSETRNGRVNVKEDTVFLNLDRSLGFANLALAANWKSRDAGRSNEDLDHYLGFEGIGNSDLSQGQTEDFERWGMEARLTSPSGDYINWLLGADVQTYKDDTYTAGSGTTAVAALVEQSTRTDHSIEKLSSYSVFGSLEAALAPHWTLAGEARVQKDDKSFLFQRIDRQPVPNNTSIAPITQSQGGPHFSPGATLRWAYAPEAQVYARLSSAYRPGGFNVGTAVVSAIPYKAEIAQSGEIGWKFKPAPHIRASLDAYYLHLHAPQVVSTVSSTDTTVVLQNVPSADYEGLELEVNGAWSLASGRLTADLSMSTESGSYGSGSKLNVNGVIYDVSDKRPSRTRDLSASLTTTFERPLVGSWSGYVTLAVTAENGGYENPVGQLKIAGVSRELPDYSLWNFKSGLKSGPLNLNVFANNLLDKRYINQNVQGNNYYNEGRVIGVTLKYAYGK